MKLDFTRVDILKCLIISRPWISRKAILSVTGFPEYFIDKSISKMKIDGLISVSRKFNNSYYYPRAMLLNNFSSTREMMEYLGISEPGIFTSRRKTDNAIFDQCKSSPHQQRIMWFYGRHAFPGFKTLA